MFPKTIETLLFERKVTKTELARHINCSRSTLDDYLTGKTQMPADRIQAVARFFGVSVGSLFGENDNTNTIVLKKEDLHELVRQQVSEMLKNHRRKE